MSNQQTVSPSSNVDKEEVKKFDEMARQWWDPNGQCKPLHDLNPLRLAFIRACCSLHNQFILDLGCGGGILTEALSENSPHVVGIDQAEHALSVAREHAKNLSTPPHYEQATAEEFALKYPGQFDVITCMEMLEHVPSPASILRACAALLKPGGHLILSTLNRTPKSFLYAIIGAEYLLKLLPKGTHEYGRFIRPSELNALAKNEGFHLKHLKGVDYDLFSKNYFLCQDVKLNYLMHFQKDALR